MASRLAFWRPEKKPRTASGQRLTRAEAASLRRVRQPWQTRAFTYRDMLGEINYASKFYGKGLAQVEYLAGEWKDGELIPTENQRVIDLVDRLQIPRWIKQYGEIMFLTGDGNLTATLDDDGEEVWEFLSMDELRATEGGRYQRVTAPGMIGEDLSDVPEDAMTLLPDTAIVYRLWTRHPRYSLLADSPMYGVLDLCEELVLFTQAIRARALNRAAGAGWLILPEEATYKSTRVVGDEDSRADPFLDDLIETMTAPLSDPGTSSAVVPLISRMGAEYIEKIRHLVFQQEGQAPYPEGDIRMDTIKRIAIGLDMPPEILLGLADSNHWTAWQIDEQVWEAHLQPISTTLVSDLTTAYLVPALKAEGLNPADFGIYSDVANAVKRPDRSSDAKDLHDRGALNDRALREASAFKEDDAPSATEPNTNPRVIAALARAAAGGGPGEATGDETPETPDGQPPDASKASVHPDILRGAASVALNRCRDLAGNRLRSKAQRFPQLLAKIEGVTGGNVAPTLGVGGVRAIMGPTAQGTLVEGGARCILESLHGWGFNAADAFCIAAQIEDYAVETLCDALPAPMPDDVFSEPCQD